MRILLIDDGLKDWSGHNAAYALALLDEMERQGLTSLLFANAAISDVATNRRNVVGAFRHFAATRFFALPLVPSSFNRLARFLTANWGHFLDLHRIVGRRVLRDDLVVVLISSARTALAYAAWLAWLSLRGKSSDIVFVVHNKPHPYFSFESRFLRTAAFAHRIHWGTHTRPVQKMCAEAAGTSFLLPLPFGAEVAADESPLLSQGQGILCSYLGVAGFSKGLDLLIDAVPQLTDLLESGALRLLIQYNVHLPNHALDALKRKLDDLSERFPGLQVVDGPLTDSKYRLRLRTADVILIPHRRRFYQDALSGIFTEALSAGKPVVLADGTYMAEELLLSGAGVCFTDSDADSLASAIRQTVGEFDQLRRLGEKRRHTWRGRHNAAQYISALELEIARAPQSR